MNAALKDLIKGLANAILLISDASKGFSFSEIGELIQVGNDIVLLKSELPLILQQYEALDDAGRKELYAVIEQQIVFPVNVKAEVIIERVVKVLVSLSEALKVLIA